MSEWQEIKTAPTDTRVLLGRYIAYNGEDSLEWRVDIGIPWETKRGWFGRLKRVRTFDGERFSHWKPQPEPPK